MHISGVERSSNKHSTAHNSLHEIMSGVSVAL